MIVYTMVDGLNIQEANWVEPGVVIFTHYEPGHMGYDRALVEWWKQERRKNIPEYTGRPRRSRQPSNFPEY